MKCSYCGEEIAENDNFCKKCVENNPTYDMKTPDLSSVKKEQEISDAILGRGNSTGKPFFQTFIGRLIGFIGAGFIFGIIMGIWR